MRDATDRSTVIGLRYSQHGSSGDGGPSPDTSDTASTWSKDGSIGKAVGNVRQDLKRV